MFPGVIPCPWGFEQDDPWAEPVEVHAAQHRFFVTFDVDFQVVDRPVGGVFLADRGQGEGG